MVGESRFGGITRGGFLGLMLVGGLVIGLFFIPELLQLSVKTEGTRGALTSPVSVSRSTVETAPTSSLSTVTTTTTTVVAPEAKSSGTWGWWSDVKDWFSSLSSPRLARVARDRESTRLAASPDARASLNMISQKLDGNSRPGQTTWATIRSNESRDAIGQARRDALELARGLPSTANGSKFAIIDFANGLEFVMTKADQQMTPRDAVVYLMKLDQSVSRALGEEKVDRVFVKRWTQISMGPVLGKTMLGQRHDSEIAPFDPQLTMTEVRVVHKGMRRGDPNTGKIDVTISGYLIGDDVKSVVMEANDGAMSIKLPLKRDPRGFWFFNRGTVDGRQTWTFKVYDKFGERFQKMYQFFPKARSFTYQKGLGYQIPYRMARATVGLFRSQDFDPQLDRYFTVAASGDAQLDPNAGFVTF